LLRYVQVSIAALDDLTDLLAKQTPVLGKTLAKRFQRAANLARDLDDPTFANVALPQGRIRVEVLQKSIEIIALLCGEELRPALGMVTGFNAMDGD
jgi:predicted lipoprotein